MPFAAKSRQETEYSFSRSSGSPPTTTESATTRSPAGLLPSKVNFMLDTQGNRPSLFGHLDTPFSRIPSSPFPVTCMTYSRLANGSSLMRSSTVKWPLG